MNATRLPLPDSPPCVRCASGATILFLYALPAGAHWRCNACGHAWKAVTPERTEITDAPVRVVKV